MTSSITHKVDNIFNIMIFPDISLDEKQKQLVSILADVAVGKKEKTGATTGIFSQIGKWLFKPAKYQLGNVYIHGGVGRGKTMIMRRFYEALLFPKLFIHYQDFMRMIHEAMHNLKGEYMHDVLFHVARKLSKKYQYICIDELEVNDIADAMIIGRVFETLLNCDIGISITSNTEPGNLYKNGLQREQFLPFIDIIKSQFIVFPLDASHDYRLDTIESIEQRVLYPLSKKVASQMQEIKNKFANNGQYVPKTLEVFGRHVTLPFTNKSVLVTNFDSLCRKNLSSNDLIAIAKSFSVIIMENVPVIEEDETDVVIRFINFIDNVYFHKVLLFISLEEEADKIYPAGKRAAEFQRTISRLYEINSHEYLEGCNHSKE